ncbi:MAG: amidohydrolase family protein [Acidimicrobiia bacterium]
MDIPKIFSVDDHVLEPPHVWQERLPRHLRDRGPQLISNKDEEYWVFDGERVKPQGAEACAGRDPKDFTMGTVRRDEMRPGFYDPVARLEDMDTDGVWAQVLFPSGVPRICGKRFIDAPDHDFGLACIQVWNDWIVEEWCDAAPDRYVPLAIVPMWDAQLCAEEVRRMAAKGTRGITFSEGPHLLGFPSIHDEYWDPLWEALSETGLVACLHIGSSGQSLEPQPGGPVAPSIVMLPMYAGVAASELMFSPIFAKWPKLHFVMSEGGIGWVPYVLERAEYTWERHRFWTGAEDAPHPLDIFRKHISVCFIEDSSGIEQRDRIGVDNIMVEIDYPHTDSSWPHSREKLSLHLKDCTQDEIDRIVYENAARVFNFPVEF